MSNNIRESGENYLETILMMSLERDLVRSVDVARELGYAKPSVSIALKKLKGQGYVKVGEKGHLILTDEGREIAEKIYYKHRLLSKALIAIGVSEKVAIEDACKIEHHISQESIDKIAEHVGGLEGKH